MGSSCPLLLDPTASQTTGQNPCGEQHGPGSEHLGDPNFGVTSLLLCHFAELMWKGSTLYFE